MHTYIAIHAYIYSHTCIHIQPYMHTYIAIHTYIDAYVHTYIHTYIHTYKHAFITCIHIYIHTYIHAYIHRYIHRYMIDRCLVFRSTLRSFSWLSVIEVLKAAETTIRPVRLGIAKAQPRGIMSGLQGIGERPPSSQNAHLMHSILGTSKRCITLCITFTSHFIIIQIYAIKFHHELSRALKCYVRHGAFQFAFDFSRYSHSRIQQTRP